jgi:hypothetical protein
MLDLKLMLFNILLNKSLRKKYNEFYSSYGFSELDSIMPKEYGIACIMGEESKGGKQKKNKKTKRKNRRVKKGKSKRKL